MSITVFVIIRFAGQDLEFIIMANNHEIESHFLGD
jgi:hypothetical protein